MSSASSVAEPSVQTLRAEAEAHRARLTDTVEDLRTQVGDTATDLKERFSPSAIKAEVSDYVRDSRDQLWHSLEEKARNNPLQAVAVGAAVAYPAFKLLRAMPAPLLLVGAGILLSRTTAQQTSVAAAASEAMRERTQTAVSAASGAMDDAADTARRNLHDAKDYARSGVDEIVNRATDAASDVKDMVADAVDNAKAAVSDTAGKVTGHAEGLAQQARQAVTGTWEQNPLLVAGIGLAIGGFMAAAFPSTQAEETLFGESSDALRRQAERAGIGAARTAVEGATAAATEQGLSVDGLSKIGQSLTDKVIAVAERGVEAALGETKTAKVPPSSSEMGKSTS